MGHDHTGWLDEETAEALEGSDESCYVETPVPEWYVETPVPEWTKEYRTLWEAAKAVGADEGALASEESFMTRKEIKLRQESIFVAAGRVYGDKVSVWETARKKK